MLLGRDAEQAHLRALVTAGHSVLVTGEPGAGRTALARAALADRRTRWAVGLAGWRWRPYAPLARAVRAPAPDAPPETVASWLAERLTDVDVLVADDVQFADPGTLAVLARLTRSLPVVALLRDGEPGADTVRAGFPDADVLTLGPLEPGDTVALLRRHGVGADPATHLAAVAGGNPLWCVQLAAAPDGSGADLHTTVAARLDRLDPAARTAVATLAVLGRPAAPQLLGAGAAAAVAAGLCVSEDATVRLRHDVVGRVALARTDEATRRRLHAALGHRLRDAAEAAHHLAAGGDVPAALAAARRAVAGASPAQRATLLTLVADLDPGSRTRLAAAQAAVEAGDPALADRLAARVDAPGDVPAASVVRAWAARRRGDFSAADRHAQTGLTAAASAPAAPAAACVATAPAAGGAATAPGAGTGAAASGAATGAAASGAATGAAAGGVVVRRLLLEAALSAPGDRATAAAQRALDACRGTAQEPAARLAVALAGLATGGTGVVGALADAVAAARAAGDAGTYYDGGWLVVRCTAAAGDAVGAAQAARRFAERAVADGSPLWAAAFRAEAAWLHVLATGPVGAAQDLAGPPAPEVMALSAADRGDLDAAAELLHGVAGPRATAVAAAAAWWAGDDARAAALAAVALADAGPDPTVEAVAAPVARWCGRSVPVRLAAVVAEAAALTVATGGDPATGGGPAAGGDPTAVGGPRTSDGERAAAAFEVAAQRWPGLAVRGVVRCRWAAFAQAGAQERYAVAVADARRHGILAIEARLAAAARRHGVRHTPLVPGADPAGPTVLSRREREVLRLVGQGLSTRLIAARLGISATTVDTHVRSAVVKLGAGNRRQAAAQLA